MASTGLGKPGWNRCSFCKERINTTAPGTWIVTSGWVSARKGASTATLRLRRDPVEFAHETCLDAEERRIKLKLSPGQASLGLELETNPSTPPERLW